MSKRKVVSFSHKGSIYDLGRSLRETLDLLNGIYNSIPSDQRDSAEMDISIDECYGSEYEITAYRLETDEEYAARDTRERREAEAHKRATETQERQVLAALKAKYG